MRPKNPTMPLALRSDDHPPAALSLCKSLGPAPHQGLLIGAQHHVVRAGLVARFFVITHDQVPLAVDRGLHARAVPATKTRARTISLRTQSAIPGANRPPRSSRALLGSVWGAARLSRGRQSANPSLRNERQLPNAESSGLEDDDATRDQVSLDRREIGKQDVDLLIRTPLGSVAKQHNRWILLVAKRKQRSKVSVRGDNHSLLLLSATQYLLVSGSLQSIVTHMHSIVSSVGQLLSDRRRERIVDQKPHTDTASGNSRSLTASAA